MQPRPDSTSRIQAFVTWYIFAGDQGRGTPCSRASFETETPGSHAAAARRRRNSGLWFGLPIRVPDAGFSSDPKMVPATQNGRAATLTEQQESMAKMRQAIAELDREIVERDQELERLKAQIDKLRRMHFGRKSEQLDRHIDRLETQLEDLAAGSDVADFRRARARASSSGASAHSEAASGTISSRLGRRRR